MNIKQIADKIIKESDVQAQYYTLADRIDDINQYYMELIEQATQSESRFPMSNTTPKTEIFTVSVYGDATFNRTIKDTGVVLVEYRPDATSEWRCMDRDTELCRDCFSCVTCGMFKADEKVVTVKNAYVGDYRVTYDKEAFVPFTTADYLLGTPPSPTFLPQEFHALLWLRPAVYVSRLYKPERTTSLVERHNELKELFDSHYARHQEWKSRLDTGEPISKI